MGYAELKENLHNIVVCLRKGKIPEAVAIVPQVLGGLKIFLTSQDPSRLEGVAMVTRGIVDSFQRKDYVLMADLLEYEILPLLREEDTKD